jgi:hypothetical protein
MHGGKKLLKMVQRIPEKAGANRKRLLKQNA